MLNKVEEEVNRTLDTAQKQMDIMKSKLHNLALKIGEGFLPLVKEAAKALGGWIDVFSDVITALAPFTTAITDLFIPLEDLKGKYEDANVVLKIYYDILIDIRQEHEDYVQSLRDEITALSETNDFYIRNAEALYDITQALEDQDNTRVSFLAGGLLMDEWAFRNTKLFKDANKEYDTFLRLLKEIAPWLDFTAERAGTMSERFDRAGEIIDTVFNPSVKAAIWVLKRVNHMLIRVRKQLEWWDKWWSEHEEFKGEYFGGRDMKEKDWWQERWGYDKKPFGGTVYKQGLYELEPGEKVVTPGQAGQSFGDIHIHISGVIGGDTREWAKKIGDELKYELRGRGVM